MTPDLLSPAKCPDRDAWSAFCLGRVDADTLHALAEHLDTCPVCRDTIQTIQPLDDGLISELRRSDSPDPFAAESECLAAMRQLRHLGAAEAPQLDPNLPERLGEYRLLEPLGRGGMGAVYRAVHSRLGRVVALKTFPPGRAKDAVAVARFHREMAAVGKLDHPHVVRATDAGEADGVAYLVMELVDGIDLGRLVRARGPLPASAACELCRQAATGLQHLSAQGIVHRDLKPSNLMLGRDGSVRILDLGLAVIPHESSDSDPTQTGQVIGTVDFMAPEQADHARAVDVRSDIYSLGCTLYYLLTGRSPYASPQYPTLRAKLAAHAAAPIPSLRDARPELPPELDDVLRRMMAKEPAGRFGSPAKLIAALEPFCGRDGLAALIPEAAALEGIQASISTPAPGLKSDPTQTCAPEARWHKRATIAIAAGVFLLCGVVAAAIYSSSEPQPSPQEGETVASLDPHLAPMPRMSEEARVDTVPKRAVPSIHPVAVLRFEERGQGVMGQGAAVADLIFARLVSQPDLLLVERSDLQKSLDELQLNASGAARPESAARVGQLTGAKVLIAGSVFRVDKKVYLTAKIIGTETSRVLGASVDGPADGELGVLADRLAGDVHKVLTENIAKVLPEPVLAVDRAAALQKKLGDRLRPSVTIRATVANDTSSPAVVEVARLAKAAGFEVLDLAAGPPAAVEFELSVTAEPAAPIGKLVPAKARVEAKVVERSTGKVLVADRQTALKVDLTPTLAAKAAVEEAAAVLAERALEKLVSK